MANLQDIESAHAKFSASGSSRWLACPASIKLSEKSPPQRNSDYAQEGSDVHACLEFLVKNRDNLGSAIKTASKKYNKEQITNASNAAKWIIAKHEEHPGSELLCETRVDASAFTCEGQFGTLDAAVVEPFGKLTVIDYKNGFIPVDPEENSQLIYYALGISNLYNHNFSEVELVVIQPRAYHESGETTRSWVCSMNELLKWEDKFRNGVQATLDPFAPTRSGSWCKFCPAATICPEIKDKAMQQAQIVFDDGVGIESVPAPQGIAIKNLGVILDACDKLDSWITKVREHALHVLERGESIDGFKLVEKRGIRKWIDEYATAKTAKRLFGDSAFSEPELLSPAQFEKAIGPKAEKFLANYVTAKSSGTTIAREADKRPAVIVATASEVFNDEPRKEIDPMTTKTTKKKVAKKKSKK